MMDSSRATGALVLFLFLALFASAWTAPAQAQAVPGMPHQPAHPSPPEVTPTQPGELADLRNQLAEANSKISTMYRLTVNYKKQIDLLTQQVEALKRGSDPQSPSTAKTNP